MFSQTNPSRLGFPGGGLKPKRTEVFNERRHGNSIATITVPAEPFGVCVSGNGKKGYDATKEGERIVGGNDRYCVKNSGSSTRTTIDAADTPGCSVHNWCGYTIAAVELFIYRL